METLKNKIEDFKMPSVDEAVYLGSSLYDHKGKLYILVGNQLKLYDIEKDSDKKLS